MTAPLLVKTQTGLQPESAPADPQSGKLVTAADTAAIRAAIFAAIRSWTLTRAGLILTVAAWSLLWGQALYGRAYLPQPLVAFFFFVGLALGAFDQRRRARAANVQSSSFPVPPVQEGAP